MGTFKKGILGGFSGKIGNVIGASWRNLDVMRSLPKKSNKLPSEIQMEQRIRFALAIGFLSPIKGLLEQAFGSTQGNKSRFNLATAYHIQQAVTGIMPNLDIDFTKVVISKGELLGAKNAAVSATNAGVVDFIWENNAGTTLSAIDDQAILLIYNPAKKLYVTDLSFTRLVGAASIVVPAEFANDVVHCYMGYLAANGKNAATSVYLGTVTVL
ncbi:DUF6266 family protein [Pedobacter boryungensis]|uniref:Uncharacterized protein n=1 Tax=Pedobacter boryungensis TaxID=869962 RepID=A0ABX2DBL8_9SPHI|nr:DUF6266 family protein [Pedobacter boryungensis]NQX30574.1 hypothetical protein [Pedobacter boryungensis]